jgi:ABC-type multidrug transport system fused ATPase/permease subunit
MIPSFDSCDALLITFGTGFEQAFLKAVLSKHIAWFDFRTAGELTTRLAGDTKLVQDAVGEKVSSYVHHTCTFLVGLTIGFVRGWHLAIVIFAILPLIAMCGAAMVDPSLHFTSTHSTLLYDTPIYVMLAVVILPAPFPCSQYAWSHNIKC